MTAITPAAAGQSAGQLMSSVQGSSLGKEDFLQLLVSQLQNQDPLNPSDPTEFTAQLAQFSSLEQLSNINQRLETLGASQELGALAFIGRDIVAEDAAFRYDGEPLELGYRLDAPADAVTLHLQDAMGRTVARLPAQGLGSGEHFLAWDGRDLDGRVVPPGDYRLLVAGLQGEEETVPATALLRTEVTGVDLNRDGVLLRTASGTFPLQAIQGIRSQ